MLVHQCGSCKKLGGNSHLKFSPTPELPTGWGRIVLKLPGENTPRVYDLCVECLKKPISFGDIELGAS